MHLNSVFWDEALASFSPPSELEELTQTYILKPLQRHAWVSLNEKQSYLFTPTLIGLKVFIVTASFTNFFFNFQLGNEKLIDVKAVCGHKSKLYFELTN